MPDSNKIHIFVKEKLKERRRSQILKRFVLFGVTCSALCFLINSKYITSYSFSSFNLNASINNDINTGVNVMEGKNCNCMRSAEMNRQAKEIKLSSCSEEATLKGPGQKVISYSLYFKENSIQEKYYFKGIQVLIDDMRKLYPGWIMRIYSDVDKNVKICQLLCNNEDLYWCNVQNIPNSESSLDDIEGNFWRVFPMSDELVDKFIVRDLDSRLTLRERIAVEEWQNSNYTFHGMRDHPYHGVPVLGGMWGVDILRFGRKRAKQFYHSIIGNATKRDKAKQKKFNDQPLLNRVLFKNTWEEWMVHDSYFCEEYRKSEGSTRPFPTQRLSGPEFLFVGDYSWARDKHYWKKTIRPCPEACRPTYGRNWTHC